MANAEHMPGSWRCVYCTETHPAAFVCCPFRGKARADAEHIPGHAVRGGAATDAADTARTAASDGGGKRRRSESHAGDHTRDEASSFSQVLNARDRDDAPLASEAREARVRKRQAR